MITGKEITLGRCVCIFMYISSQFMFYGILILPKKKDAQCSTTLDIFVVSIALCIYEEVCSIGVCVHFCRSD